jgi:hypothetical protein
MAGKNFPASSIYFRDRGQPIGPTNPDPEQTSIKPGLEPIRYRTGIPGKDRSRVMTMDRPAAEAAAVALASENLPPSARRSIFLYLGILIVLLAFGGPSGGLIGIPISYFLKKGCTWRRGRSRISSSSRQSRSICPLCSDSSAICGIRFRWEIADSCCCSAPSARFSISALPWRR